MTTSLTSTRPSLRLPAGWRPVRRASGIDVAADGPPGGDGVRPRLELWREPVPEPTLGAWQDRAMRDLAARLVAFDVEDADEFDLLGRPVAYRRHAHLLGGRDLICDRWAWLADGTGVTLVGTVPRADYWDCCDVFEAVAESVDPG